MLDNWKFCSALIGLFDIFTYNHKNRKRYAYTSILYFFNWDVQMD